MWDNEESRMGQRQTAADEQEILTAEAEAEREDTRMDVCCLSRQLQEDRKVPGQKGG